jgi:hypothetical protein
MDRLSRESIEIEIIPITLTGKEASMSVGPGSHYYID